MTIFGWDASDFDWPRGNMDLQAARNDGIQFFSHKATEGTDVTHDRFGEAIRRARAAGIPFLAPYHVVRTGDIGTQVDFHLRYVTWAVPDWQTIPGWFFQTDLEPWPYDAVGPDLGVQFAAEIEHRTGKKSLLYAPRWGYGDRIGGTAPLWASSYTNGSGSYHTLYPGDESGNWVSYSGRVPAILQFNSTATIGYQPTCDANAFRGTVADFATLIHAAAPKPNTPPEEEKMHGYLVKDGAGQNWVIALDHSNKTRISPNHAKALAKTGKYLPWPGPDQTTLAAIPDGAHR